MAARQARRGKRENVAPVGVGQRSLAESDTISGWGSAVTEALPNFDNIEDTKRDIREAGKRTRIFRDKKVLTDDEAVELACREAKWGEEALERRGEWFAKHNKTRARRQN